MVAVGLKVDKRNKRERLPILLDNKTTPRLASLNGCLVARPGGSLFYGK